MRKVFVTLLFFILLITCLFGCIIGKGASSSTLSNDKEIVDLVKEIEENDAKYYEHKIRYEEYLDFLDKVNKNLSEIIVLSEEELKEFHFDRCYIFEVVKLGKNKEEMTMDEFQRWNNDLIKRWCEESNQFPWDISKIEVSDVFYDTETNFQYVFTKIYWRYYLEHRLETFAWLKDTYAIRKYTFIQEEGNWKLLAVEKDEKRVFNGEELETKLDKLNGEAVEFLHTIDL